MKRRRLMTQAIGVTFAVAALLSLGVMSLWAGHFERPSSAHIGWGVSQFLASTYQSEEEISIILSNPNHVTHAAAALAYTSVKEPPGSGGGGGTGGLGPEVFLNCEVLELTPHASKRFMIDSDSNRDYLEVISAPVTPVHGHRLADGLGIIGQVNYNDEGEKIRLALVNPALFTLPDNHVVEGQREDAIDCICERVFDLGLPHDVFTEVGGFTCHLNNG